MASAHNAATAHMNSQKQRHSLPSQVNRFYHYLRLELTLFLYLAAISGAFVQCWEGLARRGR